MWGKSRHTGRRKMRLEGVSCVCGRTSSFPAGERNQRLPGAGEVSMRRAGPRTPLRQISCVGGASQGRPERSSLRFRTNGPVENVPFSTRACAWRREGAAWVGRASHADFLWRSASEKASPERGGAREAGGGVSSPRSVTTTKSIGDAPTFRRN